MNKVLSLYILMNFFVVRSMVPRLWYFVLDLTLSPQM